MIGKTFVVDGHAHIGRSSVTGVENTESALLLAMQKHGIDAAIVLPHGTQDLSVSAEHDRIARLVARHPQKFFGVASLSPRLDSADYQREATRCVRELGFRGLKFDPNISAIPINHARAEIVFATAQELGVPVMIHTGGGSFAQPSLAIPPARRYPQLTIVLSHAGLVTSTPEAIIAAQVCPNIVLEHSWCASHQLAEMVRVLGAERVMFGSDHLTNIASELAKAQSLDLDDAQLAQLLGGTARRVFIEEH